MFIANFFLHITPNPYRVGVTGVLLAWLATWAVVVFRDRPKKLAEAEDKIRVYACPILWKPPLHSSSEDAAARSDGLI